MKEYKVLSLWEPWASLLVHGVKKIETRPKPTSWTIEKGSYLIHAAKKWGKDQHNICCTDPFLSELKRLGLVFGVGHLYGFSFDLGHIIGAVDVVECLSIYKGPYTGDYYLTPEKGFPMTVEEPELSFGDYREGRYAWLCDNFRVLEKPIPYNGQQGYYAPFKGDVNQLKFKI